MSLPKDGNGLTLKEGDKVWAFDIDGSQIFGVLYPNKGHEDVSEWYVEYEDGNDCAVLDFSFLFKAD